MCFEIRGIIFIYVGTFVCLQLAIFRIVFPDIFFENELCTYVLYTMAFFFKSDTIIKLPNLISIYNNISLLSLDYKHCTYRIGT